MVIQEVPLESVPNQTLSFSFNDRMFSVSLFTRIDRVYASVDIDGVPMVKNRIALPGVEIVPGIFFVSDSTDPFISYTQFEVETGLFVWSE